jgi:ubiquinone biosynthesis protein
VDSGRFFAAFDPIGHREAMGISLKPDHLRRYAQLSRLLVKYGRSDLVRSAELEETLEGDGSVPEPGSGCPEELAADLERLGPTFIKLGQLLSTRADLLPLSYTEALARLQDDVEPFDSEEAERIIAEEIGVRPSKAFLELDRDPIAAASLGQVHRARLRDGRHVAVKVQRPGIRARIVEDMDALEELAEFLDSHTEAGRRYEFSGILGEMRSSIMRELDYRREAQNLRTLSANLEEFERIVVPVPVEDFTTSRVLTMEYVHGRKVTSVGPLARLEMDGVALADELFKAYLKQILVDGFFHADPHPGNVFLTDDGRIALIDVGMVGRITPGLQDELLRLLLAISDGRGEEAAALLAGIGEKTDDFNERALTERIVELVMLFHGATARQLQIGRVMIEVTRSAADAGLRLPSQMTTLGKTLLNLDQVGRTLDPDFEPNEAIRRHTAELMQRRMRKNASPANVFSSLMEMNEFVQRLPSRLNRVLDSVADNDVEVGIRLRNESVFVEGMQKVANRIAMGLVLAALIIGAAMLMQVETAFTILGYPGLAMLCFAGAALGGVWLVIDILLHDRNLERNRDE